MADQGEKSVEEITKMFNKLNELGLLEKMLEEARLKKEAQSKNDDKKEATEEKPKDNLSSVLKIEKWTGEKDAIIKTLMLIATEDYSKIYNMSAVAEFAYDILEKNGIELNNKPIISSKDMFTGLSNQVLIDLECPQNIRVVKVEKSAIELLTLSGKNILVNKIPNMLIRLVSQNDKNVNGTCLVKEADLKTFPQLGSKDCQHENVTFYTIDSWFRSHAHSEKALISKDCAQKMPIYTCADKNDRPENIGIMSAIEISEKVCIEKYVLVASVNANKNSVVYNIVKRVLSPAINSIYDAVVNMLHNTKNYLNDHKLQDGSDVMLTMMLRDDAKYQATHFDVVINKAVYESLNFVTPKNKELRPNDFNRIYNLSLNEANLLTQMLITAEQYNLVAYGTNKTNIGACLIGFLYRNGNNITEEHVLTHTSWRDGAAIMTTVKILDAKDKSGWSTKYMRISDFDTAKKEKSTFEGQSATFMKIIIDGLMCNCLVTDNQLTNITMA